MEIAVISSTTIPACLPDDKRHFTTYGSEAYNAVLVQALAERGHTIHWYAPIGSTTFNAVDQTGNSIYPNVRYYPIVDSKGKHMASELLENICFMNESTEDLTDCDFVIDMSKQNHVTEEIKLYYGYNKYCNYKSGYQDWNTPWKAPAHFVTHCQAFADNFQKNGKPRPDVARFGIPDFWCPGRWGDVITEVDWLKGVGLTYKPEDLGCRKPIEYFLFPHRPNKQKGLNKFIELARQFPDKTFVISTAAVFEDHIREMAQVKQDNKLSNIKFIDCPKNTKYHHYRRTLMRHAAAVLSPFSSYFLDSGPNRYLDTGGLVSFEAVRCGTPVIVTRSEASTEMLGTLDGEGVVFVDDGMDSLRNAIKTNMHSTRPKVDRNWMSIDHFVYDYEEIMKKYEM